MNSPSLTIAALMAGMALATTASAQETPVNPTGKAMPQPEASTAAAGADASATAKADLSGLKTGQTVKTSAGATLGTVSRIDKDGADGVKTVTVTGADGKTHTLMSNSLSVSGDVVTTTTAGH